MQLNREKVGLMIGMVGFITILVMSYLMGSHSPAMSVLAVAFLMASWWVTEAIPIPATALLPIVLFPILGVIKAGEITLSYGNHYVFLFLGGFLIAVTVERWNLHKRIALYTIAFVGTSASQIILGFMLASAFLSMWISNIATTMMMVTIAQAVLKQLVNTTDKHDQQLRMAFATALMLGIAYASSIGGIATLVGTAPNAIFAGVYESHYGHTISFLQWFSLCFPLTLIMLFITWRYLTSWFFSIKDLELQDGQATIQKEILQLGKTSYEEKMTLIVFVSVAVAWICRGLFDLSFLQYIKDSTIAVAGALLLFLIPARSRQGSLLDWQTAVKIPWDILLLFGGGFALAKGFDHSGLTVLLAEQLKILQGAHAYLIVLAVTALVIFLTEITSNTATATLFVPVMLSLGIAMNMPVESLMLAACLAASFAFMLPVATPPNAVVFSTRCISIQQMVRAGLGLNLIGMLLISLWVYLLQPLLW